MASLAIRYCRLIIGGERFRTCLDLHPAVDPSTCTLPKPIRKVVAIAIAGAITHGSWSILLKKLIVSISSEPRLKVLSGKAFDKSCGTRRTTSFSISTL